MKKYLLILLSLLLFWNCSSQNNTFVNKQNFKTNKPKIMIGIVIDQMRYDYLYRFYEKFGNNGFKRLLENGYVLENVHLNYTPTHTAVGHSSIYTGTTPSIHGIIANNWYDKNKHQSIYCVDDSNFKTVGGAVGGEKSPYRLQVTTVSDQLHLGQVQRGKVIGISMKDRSAMLPVGHTANAAYWFNSKGNGNFITSTFYMNDLPDWVKKFNSRKLPDSYLSKDWNTFYKIKDYTESIVDENNFERKLKGEDDVSFPHTISKIFNKKKSYNIINLTPSANDLLTEFAKATILGENLGNNKDTDFLSISFSATDYIGHQFGVDSKEVEDVYIRLDKNIEELLLFFDKKIGRDKYTLFLTADHGALPAHPYLKSLKIPSRFFDTGNFTKYVNKLTLKKYGSDNLIENISNYQIFFNYNEIEKLKIDKNKLASFLVDSCIQYDGVYKVFTAKDMQTANFNEQVVNFTQNGYNQKISGDVVIIPNPATVSYMRVGTEHSTGYGYDTHIPLVFYGYGIKKGDSKRYIPVVDIAPTLTYLLKVQAPNGNKGKVITEVFK